MARHGPTLAGILSLLVAPGLSGHALGQLARTLDPLNIPMTWFEDSECPAGGQLDANEVWKSVNSDDDVERVVRENYAQLAGPKALAQWFVCQGFIVNYIAAPGGRCLSRAGIEGGGYCVTTSYVSSDGTSPLKIHFWQTFLRVPRTSIDVRLDSDGDIVRVNFNIDLL